MAENSSHTAESRNGMAKSSLGPGGAVDRVEQAASPVAYQLIRSAPTCVSWQAGMEGRRG